MRVAFRTLGCKVNQFETGALERLLITRGHTVTSWANPADAYVINTCTVTAVSDKKSRQAIRGVRRKYPDAVVAVCGCLGQAAPGVLLSLGADLVAGTGDRLEFINLLEQTVRSDGRPRAVVVDAAAHKTFERLPAGSSSGRTRALLKVQDGCQNQCAYCVIPQVRGPERSLPPEEAAGEAARLAAEGYREIVITGIEISSYGCDLECDIDLIGLVERVCRAARGARVRLGSLAPSAVTRAFAERLPSLPNLCPHFHLSLQSGCDDTLARMRRRYDTARYFEVLSLLRGAFPDCAVTTDLIVGFPGETEEEFAQSLLFAERCAFADMHVFPYSRRAGTPAASFSCQISRADKKIRAARADKLAAQMAQTFARRCVGRVFEVLFEEEVEDGGRGHAENYRVVTCAHTDGAALRGRIRPVRVTGVRNVRELSGEIIEEEPITQTPLEPNPPSPRSLSVT